MERQSKVVKKITGAMQQVLSDPPEANVKEGITKGDIPQLTKSAAVKTASISGTLAMPGGFTGLVTVVPEIISIWRIQAQLIANIAHLHGKQSTVTKEQMLYCMFRQVGYGMVKEFVIQRGGVYVVHKLQNAAFQAALQKLGLNLAGKHGARMVGKVIPVLGGVSAGALSFYDTKRAARRANELYGGKIIEVNQQGEEQWFL